MRTLVINFLSKKALSSEDALPIFARQYQIAQWFDNDQRQLFKDYEKSKAEKSEETEVEPSPTGKRGKKKQKTKEKEEEKPTVPLTNGFSLLPPPRLHFFKSQWTPPRSALSTRLTQDDTLVSLSRDGIVRVARQLGQKQKLMHSFRTLFMSIVRLMVENQPKLRAKVIKVLGSVVEANGVVLEDAEVRKAVE